MYSTSDLGYRINPAILVTNSPPILRAQAWAAEYESTPASTSSPVLNLAQGVPRSAPHPSVLESLSKASSDPSSARYGPIMGEVAFRQALSVEINTQYRLESAPPASRVGSDDIGITTGCNMAFLAVLMVLCPPGSSILLPLPAYFNITMSCSLQNVNPVYIPSLPDDGFKPSLSAARKLLSKDRNSDASEDDKGEGKKEGSIRMIVLISPNNPTGAVYTPHELKGWYDLAEEFGVALLLDETYRDFVEDMSGDDEGAVNGEAGVSRARGRGKPHGLFEIDGWRRRLISISSMSKGYRIPGHRLGSIIAAPQLLEQVKTVADCMQICAPRPPQIALTPLLASLRPDLLASSQSLSNRRHLIRKVIDSIPGWSISSSGAYFAYVRFPDAYMEDRKGILLGDSGEPGANGALNGTQGKRKVGSEDVCRELALRVGVVTLAGSFFLPPLHDEKVWAEVEEVGGGALKEDMWLRFAVANIEDDVVLQLEPRLRQMNKLMGMEAE